MSESTYPSIENCANEIFQSALYAVDPKKIVTENIFISKSYFTIGGYTFDKSSLEKIHLIGFGKAAIPMAKGIISQFGEMITGGVVVTKHLERDTRNFPESIKILQGDHPIPSQNSVYAANELVDYLKNSGEKDLVICLISGGGSALVTLPRDPISIFEVNVLTQELLVSGASIDELNCVRKHIDLIKGGGLLKYIYPSKSINLVLSDVIGDDLSVIASGPTSYDSYTFSNAIEILKKYHLWNSSAQPICDLLNQGEKGFIAETVKKNDPILSKSINIIIGNLAKAAEAAKKSAEACGFFVDIYNLHLTGEASENGKKLAKYLIAYKRENAAGDKPICIIAGGESTVAVKGSGKGGRNQEIALAAAIELDGTEGFTVLSLATDGEDGPTDAAGAIVDSHTIEKARQMGLNAVSFLCENNAYEFFSQIGGLIKTGSTGTNVNDLVFMFAEN